MFLDSILARTFYHWNAKRLFGIVGSRSYCIKPLRVINGKNVFLGNNVRILHYLRIETYRTVTGSVGPIIVIGNDTNIEQNVHTTGGEHIIIGSCCSLLGGVVITDINHLYEDLTVSASKQPIKCKPVNIGDDCFIGMHTMIMPGVSLGKHVIVGANSVVTKSFPDNCVIAGVPAQIIKKYDAVSKKWVMV